jgi:hypothetical protein
MIERDGERTKEGVEEGELNSDETVKETVNRPQLNSRSCCNKLLFSYVGDARTLKEKDRECVFFKDAIIMGAVFTRGSRKQWDTKRRNQNK